MTRIMILLAVLVILAVAPRSSAVSNKSVAAAPLSRWYREYPVHPGSIWSISCPTAKTCYAAGASGSFVASQNGGAHWQHPAPGMSAAYDVRSLSCVDALHCWAVAVQTRAGADVSTAVLASADGGHNWSVQYRGAGGGATAIACSSLSDCAFLSENVLVSTADGGQTWSTHALPLPTTAMYAASLACPAGQTCYVDGTETRAGRYGAVLRTDDGGKTWRTSTLRPGKLALDLGEVSCPTVNDCYIANLGSRSVVLTHDRGGTWTVQPTGLSTPYEAIACPDASTCYLRVSEGSLTPSGPASVARTTDGGKTWRALPPESDRAMYGYDSPPGFPNIACPTAGHCLETQLTGDISRTTDAARSWTRVYVGAGHPLSALSCTAGGSCFATATGRVLLASRGGRTWQQIAYPAAAGAATLVAVRCFGGGNCLAAGTDGTIIGTGGAGAGWHRVLTLRIAGASAIQLNGVACPSSRECFAVGAAYGSTGRGRALAVRTSDGGIHWTRLSVPDLYFLTGIYCLSARTCFAYAGSADTEDDLPYGGLLLTRDAGKTWRTLDSDAVRGLVCPDTSRCYAAGEYRGYGGSGFAPLLFRVSGAGVISNRTILKRFGRTTLNGIGCVSRLRCYAVGAGGIVAQTNDGSRWTSQQLGGGFDLDAISCPAICYAAGSDSTILSFRRPTSGVAVPTATPARPPPPATPQPSPTPRPTEPPPTTVPAASGCPPACTPGMVLYRADWSHGLNGWTLANGAIPAGWKVKNGILISHVSAAQSLATSLYPPFQPGPHGINDYAVVFQARLNGGFTTDTSMHVNIRQNGSRYYDWRLDGNCCPDSVEAAIVFYDTAPRSGFDSVVGNASVSSMEKGWHSYRMEVKGDSLRFFIDGALVVRGLDRHQLKGGLVSLMNQFDAVQIRNFEIVAL